MANSLLAVNLSSVVLESLLYGIFLVLFCVGFYLLCQSRRDRLWWDPVVFSTLGIFLTCTMHWILSSVLIFPVFLGSQPRIDIACTTGKVDHIVSLMTMWIGDVVIVHRLWIVWNHDLRVTVIPVLSLIGLIGCGIADLFQIPAASWGMITTASWIFSLINNVYCTAFISCRIWRVRRAPQESEFKPLMPVLAIIMESAAILAAWTIFFAITIETNSKLALVAIGSIPQMVGISNMLIHIRISTTHKRSSDDTGVAMTSPASIMIIRGVTFPTTGSVATRTIKESSEP
ncbi:hypothetical protein GGX14DRAFT_484172 [Mycena pura]|uniref:Uncharacterized protein n=1 Tax=Mycena pura TaxID=153505 RepID=A0AAD6UP89_9AGAR|nr:hypothetical protein GGX14DRAFT_484172 [Mycena pura]